MVVGIWTALAYTPCFLLGMALWHRQWHFTGQQALLSLAGFAIAGAVVASHPNLQSFLFRHLPNPVHEDWFGMVWVAFLIPALGWVLGQKSSQTDRRLGDLSYALYLVHWPVITMVRPGLLPLDMTDRGILLSIIFATSLFFFMLIDRPLDACRRKLIARLMTNQSRRTSLSKDAIGAKATGWISSRNGSKLAPFALNDLPRPPPSTRPDPSFGSKKIRGS